MSKLAFKFRDYQINVLTTIICYANYFRYRLLCGQILRPRFEVFFANIAPLLVNNCLSYFVHSSLSASSIIAWHGIARKVNDSLMGA